MGLEEAGDLHGHFLTATRRARNLSCFGYIVGHGDADATQQLNAFGDTIDEFDLFAEMLIEKQMQLIKRFARDLPMMFFVQVSQAHSIGKDLVQHSHAVNADCLVKTYRQPGNGSEFLNFASALMGDGLRTRARLALPAPDLFSIHAIHLSPWAHKGRLASMVIRLMHKGVARVRRDLQWGHALPGSCESKTGPRKGL